MPVIKAVLRWLDAWDDMAKDESMQMDRNKALQCCGLKRKPYPLDYMKSLEAIDTTLLQIEASRTGASAQPSQLD